MAKHTQAHLTRTVKKNQPTALASRTKSQMEYYMGAKLIEIGVNPDEAIYRWSVESSDGEQIWTISAYWGESKEQLLTGALPLTGTDLIDCARANASGGLETTASLCGYGEDQGRFLEALKQDGEKMGLEIESLSDLMSFPPSLTGRKGIEVAPDKFNSL